MKHPLVQRITRLARVRNAEGQKGLWKLRLDAKTAMERVDGKDAGTVLGCYGKARVKYEALFEKGAEVLKRDLGADLNCGEGVITDILEATKAGWVDSVLGGLVLSRMVAPSADISHRRVGTEAWISGLQLAVVYNPSFLTRLLSVADRHVRHLTSTSLGSLCRVIVSCPPGTFSSIPYSIFTLKPLLLNTLSVAEASNVLLAAHHTCLPSPLPLFSSVFSHISRPFYEASLILEPPSCLLKILTAASTLPDPKLRRAYFEWVADMRAKHFTLPLPPYVQAGLDRLLD
eukprot:TRINITY_DN14712_c0_g1_i1.p1 TRINITY_DN14712_c0_g1~~TRINITY_DN14712_c0_g1_i1.p1  ORF type:complete len:288 (+),score=42.06 TRINITY_DN14712_c0_g1_i1:67-930(+)